MTQTTTTTTFTSLLFEPLDLDATESLLKHDTDDLPFEIVDILYHAMRDEQTQPLETDAKTEPEMASDRAERLKRKRRERRQSPPGKASDAAYRKHKKHAKRALRLMWHSLELQLRRLAMYRALAARDEGTRVKYASYVVESDEVLKLVRKVLPSSAKGLLQVPTWAECQRTYRGWEDAVVVFV